MARPCASRLRLQRTLLASLVMWAAFFVCGEVRAQEPADDPAYCSAQPGAPDLLPVVSSECLAERQRALKEQQKALIVAGRVRHYKARMLAGHIIGILGAVGLGVSFVLLLDSSNFHGSIDEGKRLASEITAGAGAALGLSGVALVVATARRNRNRAQINQLVDEMEAIADRRRELKRMKLRWRMQPYASLNGVGLRLAF